jgi:hypothetical protein
MFKLFISFCIIGCKLVHRSCYLLMFYLEVANRGSTQHDSRLEFKLGCPSTRIFYEKYCCYLLIPRGGILEVVVMRTKLMYSY